MTFLTWHSLGNVCIFLALCAYLAFLFWMINEVIDPRIERFKDQRRFNKAQQAIQDLYFEAAQEVRKEV